MKSRYCYCPMTAKRIGRRLTMLERLRRWLKAKPTPDLFMVTGFEAPIYPTKNP